MCLYKLYLWHKFMLMEITSNILEALVPVIALVVAGYGFRKSQFLPNSFWDSAETLTFYVLFPALILFRLLEADFSKLDITPLLTTSLLFFALLTAISWLYDKKFMNLEQRSWTSFLQGSIRYNTFIALALADKIFGPAYFTVSALLIAIFIIVVNAVTVIAFSLTTKPSAVALITRILKNPLIIACLLGLFLNVSALPMPGFITETMSVFGRAALPLAILAVGAGLKIKSLQSIDREIIAASIIKLIIAPIVMVFLTFLFIDDQQVRSLLILFGCIPTASAAYIMARKMGGDAELMASIITFQTIVSAFTVSAILFFIL